MIVQVSVEKYANFLSIYYSNFKKTITENESRISFINLTFSAEDARFMIQKK